MLFSDVAVTKYAKTTSEVEKVIHFWFKDSSKRIHREIEKKRKADEKRIHKQELRENLRKKIPRESSEESDE